MMLYHGSDNPKLTFVNVKPGHGYHPGAGPVEFLGPSFSDSSEVAASYGKYVYQVDFNFHKPKHFKSLHALRNRILKTFAPPVSGYTFGKYYRDIADSYRIKLIVAGYDAIVFPEGTKQSTGAPIGNTIIILSVSDSICVRSSS